MPPRSRMRTRRGHSVDLGHVMRPSAYELRAMQRCRSRAIQPVCYPKRLTSEIGSGASSRKSSSATDLSHALHHGVSRFCKSCSAPPRQGNPIYERLLSSVRCTASRSFAPARVGTVERHNHPKPSDLQRSTRSPYSCWIYKFARDAVPRIVPSSSFPVRHRHVAYKHLHRARRQY